MDLTKNIAGNLSAWMTNNPNLDTIKKVASRSGVGFGTVQRAKNGDGNPTITNLGDIAHAFGKRVEDLIADPQGENAPLAIREPASQYNAGAHEIAEYLNELDPQEVEIFTQELKLAAMKARKKRQEMKDRLPSTGNGDPPLEVRRTA